MVELGPYSAELGTISQEQSEHREGGAVTLTSIMGQFSGESILTCLQSGQNVQSIFF